MNGGLPQGTKLGPLLFEILVNNLLKNWPGRSKFVDDTTTFEIIPRGSPIILPMGLPVEVESTFKLLGVMLCNDLTWRVHVDYVLKKANSRLYAPRKLRKLEPVRSS